MNRRSASVSVAACTSFTMADESKYSLTDARGRAWRVTPRKYPHRVPAGPRALGGDDAATGDHLFPAIAGNRHQTRNGPPVLGDLERFAARYVGQIAAGILAKL